MSANELASLRKGERDGKASNEFTVQFVNNLLHDGYSVQTRNFDWLRYNPSFGGRIRERLKDSVAQFCRKLRLVPCRYDATWLPFILEHLDEFSEFFCLLRDSHSRETLLKVLEFRVLGPRHVKLPLNNSEFWGKYRTIDEKYARKLRSHSAWNRGWSLNRYEIPVTGQVVKLDAHPLNL